MMQRGRELYSVVLAPPFQRLSETPGWGKFLGVMLGAASSAMNSLGVIVVTALVVLSILDWYLGSRIAMALKGHDPAKAQLGKLEKMTAIALVILLLALDYWLSYQGRVNSGGWVGTTLGVWWAIDELRSVLKHRKAVGGSVPAWLERMLQMGYHEIDARVARLLGVRSLEPSELEEVKKVIKERAVERANGKGKEGEA